MSSETAEKEMRVSAVGEGAEDARAASMMAKGSYYYFPITV